MSIITINRLALVAQRRDGYTAAAYSTRICRAIIRARSPCRWVTLAHYERKDGQECPSYGRDSFRCSKQPGDRCI